MEVTVMNLADLVKAEKNVRIHTEQQLKEFERSIAMFGQIRPIVVDENNVILAGNGLYDTLVMMGEKTADVYKYENLTENQKKKLMIADNKIFSLGIDNLETLDNILEELQGDLDIPGFDEEILKQLVSEAEEVTDKIAEYGTLNEEEIRGIKESTEKRGQQVLEEELKQKPNLELEEQIQPEVGQEDRFFAERSHIVCPKCGEEIWL